MQALVGAMGPPVAVGPLPQCVGRRSRAAFGPAWRGCQRPPCLQQRLGPAPPCAARGSDVGNPLRDVVAQPAQGQGDAAYVAASAFLQQELGLNGQAELNRILDLAMNPNSIFGARERRQPLNPHARKLGVDADLKPVLAFFLAQGFSLQQVARLVSQHPPLLCYSVQERLQPLCEFLGGELGLGQGRLVALLEQRPSLLAVEQANMRRIVEYLRESGKGMEEIAQLLESSL